MPQGQQPGHPGDLLIGQDRNRVASIVGGGVVPKIGTRTTLPGRAPGVCALTRAQVRCSTISGHALTLDQSIANQSPFTLPDRADT